MKVGIIGGTGRMGRFFQAVFERAGCVVEVCGRASALSCSDVASRSDVIVVSVPIRDTVWVIGQITPLLGPDQVLCDLTSLKTEPMKAMCRSRASVVGLHPMFGPGVSSLTGQTIIVTPSPGDQAGIPALLEIFVRQGARLTFTDPETHDRIMAIVQGLTHFVTLSVAETMRKLGVRPADTEAFMSPVYHIEMGLVGRLLAQDPELYGDIFTLNPYVPEVLGTCSDSIRELRDIVSSGDRSRFIEIFRDNAGFFDNYRSRASEETDFLIEMMVKR